MNIAFQHAHILNDVDSIFNSSVLFFIFSREGTRRDTKVKRREKRAGGRAMYGVRYFITPKIPSFFDFVHLKKKLKKNRIIGMVFLFPR
jgi:hypothetical protein